MQCSSTPMIVIYKGEDSTLHLNRRPVIHLVTPSALSDYTARFKFFGIEREFNKEQVASKKLVLTFSAEDTKELPFGMNYATLTLTDKNGISHSAKIVIGVANREFVVMDGLGVAIDGYYETETEVLDERDVTPGNYTNGTIADATLKMWKKLGGTVTMALIALSSLGSLPPGYSYNENLGAKTPVVTNAEEAVGDKFLTREEADSTYLKEHQSLEPATNYTDSVASGISYAKRDRDDYRVYRKVKDCWTWRN